MSVLTTEQATQIWERALTAEGDLEIRFPTAKQAHRARFVLYNVRKKLKQEQANAEDMPIDLVESVYDAFTISLETRKNGVIMAISQNIPFDELEIIDTGKQRAMETTE